MDSTIPSGHKRKHDEKKPLIQEIDVKQEPDSPSKKKRKMQQEVGDTPEGEKGATKRKIKSEQGPVETPTTDFGELSLGKLCLL